MPKKRRCDEPSSSERRELAAQIQKEFGYDEGTADLCSLIAFEYFTDLLNRLYRVRFEASETLRMLRNWRGIGPNE